jgi:hypothetical protein
LPSLIGESVASGSRYQLLISHARGAERAARLGNGLRTLYDKLKRYGLS